MNKKIDDIINTLSDQNTYGIKYIGESNYDVLKNEIKELLIIHSVVSSLPTSKDRISELEKSIVSWDLKNDIIDKQAFSCGWNNCYRWIKDFVRQQR